MENVHRVFRRAVVPLGDVNARNRAATRIDPAHLGEPLGGLQDRRQNSHLLSRSEPFAREFDEIAVASVRWLTLQHGDRPAAASELQR
jgi:hypothetical protein